MYEQYIMKIQDLFKFYNVLFTSDYRYFQYNSWWQVYSVGSFETDLHMLLMSSNVAVFIGDNNIITILKRSVQFEWWD